MYSLDHVLYNFKLSTYLSFGLFCEVLETFEVYLFLCGPVLHIALFPR